MGSMFAGCLAFNEFLNKWNVANVTNMSFMFSDCRAFNQPLENWNVGNVTNMYFMFAGCLAFNQLLNKWNVANVTYMDSMFQDCQAFNQPLENWNVGNVTDMSFMFKGCDAFNQPLTNWNVGSMTTMKQMFDGCHALSADRVSLRFVTEFYASKWHHHPTKEPRSPETIRHELVVLQEEKRKLDEKISKLQQEKASGIIRKALCQSIPAMRTQWPYRPPGAFGDFDLLGGHEFRSAEERWNKR